MLRLCHSLPRGATQLASLRASTAAHSSAALACASLPWPAASSAVAALAAAPSLVPSGVRRMSSGGGGGGKRPYTGKKSLSGKKRNTFGSNEYRKKRAAERQRRHGLDFTAADMPIQAVWSQGAGQVRHGDRNERRDSYGGSSGRSDPFDPRTRERKPVPTDGVSFNSIPLPSSDALASAARGPPPAHAALCCGCGAAFQSAFQDAPGFLPPEQLKKFVERRMSVWEARQLKQKQAAEAEAAKLQQRAANAEQTEGATDAASGDAAAAEPSDAADAADAASADPTDTTAASSSTPPRRAPAPLPSWSSAFDPHLARQAKLDPSLPLAAQDLSIALNHGLLHEGDLLPHGVTEDMIMSKKELLALEKREKEEERERRGEGNALRCLRCFQLANYGYTKGQVSSVRAEDFRRLLQSRFLERGGRSCVILKVVDLFDFHGSFIRDFSSIVGGRNPIILVANKYDLLPRGVGENRLRAWIKAEASAYGLHFHSIEIVSAITGHNLFPLVRAAQALAEPDPLTDRPRRDIYIVGTTNVGKSSIVNKLIEKRLITSKGQFQATRIRTEEGDDGAASEGSEGNQQQSMYLSASHFMPTAAQAASSSSTSAESGSTAAPSAAALHSTFNVLGGHMTASIVPGTTLGMVAFPFIPSYGEQQAAAAAQRQGARKSTVAHVLYDTPGVVNPEQLSSYLTYHELRAVMPKRQVQPLSYRMAKGQTLLLGGLARLDYVEGDRDYIFVTVFASRNVTVHLTQIEKMDNVPPARKKRAAAADQQQEQSADGEQSAEQEAQSTRDAQIDAPRNHEAPSVPADARAAHVAASSSLAPSTTAEDDATPREIGYLEFIKKHAGKLIFPPFSPERAREIGLHVGTRVTFDFHGRGWLEACEDVVFPGLGWVGITGSGRMLVRAVLPGQVKAYAREPLMPFESRHNMKKFVGSAIRQH